MKEITIAVPDDKYELAVSLVKNLKFVKKVKGPKSASARKAKFLKELSESIEEMKLIEAGKKKGISMEEFLNEL